MGMHHQLKVKNGSDGLLGMWCHTLDADGDIDRQLPIARRSGDVYLCTSFSWIDGRPDECVAISRHEILSSHLYMSCEAMNAAFEKRAQQERLKLQHLREEPTNIVRPSFGGEIVHTR
jgi:hypothetical protein